MNKILCWLWGHQFDNNYQLSAIKKFFTLSYFGKNQILVKTCIRCGAHKHDQL